MSLFVVDVEADGPAPGLYSMVCFGAVVVTDWRIGESFFGRTRPISDQWLPQALAVSAFTREEHLQFDAPADVMRAFADWVARVNQGSRPVFVSDNPAFDWQFVNYYFWRYLNGNPFGHSARRIGDFAAGLAGDFFAKQSWKTQRKTRHTHNPVDDARGNAEALIALAARARANRAAG
jgi:hypothetical protein